MGRELAVGRDKGGRGERERLGPEGAGLVNRLGSDRKRLGVGKRWRAEGGWILKRLVPGPGWLART